MNVQVLVHGKTVQQISHNGNTYIEAHDGSEYSIRIQNSSAARKLCVISVDGVNVITGQPAQECDIVNGYIVNGFSSIEIKGFRTDVNNVGAFKFCKKANGYCNEKGLKGNNGVIGVRVYDEMARPLVFKGPACPPDIFENAPKITHPPYIPPPTWIDPHLPTITCLSNVKRGISNATYSTCCSSSVPDFSAATTWGQKISDSVTYVDFEVDSCKYVDYIIYYDTRNNLEKAGVKTRKEKQMPKAFGAFATPPKGWRG